MAYDVEENVVKMRFDNSDFQPNVDASIRSLGELEKALRYADGTTTNFSGTEKSLNKLDESISTSIISLDNLSKGFSALGVAAVTVISDITRKIEHMGINTLNQLFVTPIKSGFAKYGDQISSTQVIMNNTGETIDRVKDSLAELNNYANNTIYNFSQMTYAVGKFAAAGVKLDDATLAIQGLSNAAAMVGANNAQLYSAYYNLSQSMQMGYLKLIDWKSIANSMIGTKQMRKEFVKTAIEMGKFTEDSQQAQEAFSNFEDSLRKKWLTSDIIVRTMQKYQDSTTDVGKAAIAAASELKSFSQMWDVISQTTQSSWAKTWQIIIGDLAGAKTVWTNIGNRISAIMKAINDARNNFLESWNKDRRATKQILEGICNVLDNIRIVLEPIYSVLVNTLNITSDKLYVVTTFFRKLTESFRLSEESISGFELVLQQIAKPIAFIVNTIGMLIHTLTIFISLIGIGLNILFMFIGNLDKMPEILTAIFGPKFESKIKNINNLIGNLSRIFGALLQIAFQFTLAILPAIAPLLESITTLFLNVLSIFGEIVSIIADSDLEWLDNIISSIVIVVRSLSVVLSVIPNILRTIFSGESGEAFNNILNMASQLLIILSKLISTSIIIGSKLISSVAPVLEKIGQIVFSIINVLLGFLNGITNLDLSGIYNVLDSILAVVLLMFNNMGKVIGFFVNLLTTGINKLTDFSKVARNVGNTISDNINIKVNATTTLGSTSVDTIANNIQSSIATAVANSNNEEISEAIVDNVRKSSPILKSASKTITKSLEEGNKDNSVGKKIVSKISKDITDGTKVIRTKSSDTPILDGLSEKLSLEFESLITLLSEFKTKLSEIVDQIAEKLAILHENRFFKSESGLDATAWKIDNFFTVIEKHKDTLDYIINTVKQALNFFLIYLPAAVVGIWALASIVNGITGIGNKFSKGMDKFGENLAKITDFKFEHVFTKEKVDKIKINVKTINAFGKAILMASAGLALVLAAIGLVFKLTENYDLSNPADQRKFYWLIGTIILTVNLFVGALIAIGNMARYTDVATDSAVVNFKDAVFNIKNAFNTIGGGIESLKGALVSLPQKLVRTKKNDPLISMSKVISSIGTSFAAIAGSISLLFLVTKMYEGNELKTRLNAIAILLGIVVGGMLAITTIITIGAKRLNGQYASRNILALGNSISKIIKSLGAVSFALKFLFNDKKAFSMPKEYLIFVGELYAAIILLVLVLMEHVDSISKNYTRLNRVWQDERFKLLARGVSLIILSFSSIVFALSGIKDIGTVPWSYVVLVGATMGAVLAIMNMLLTGISVISLNYTRSKTVYSDNRILKLALAMSMIIASMAALVASFGALKDIGNIGPNTLAAYGITILSIIGGSIFLVNNVGSVFKNASKEGDHAVELTNIRSNRILKLAAAIDIIIGGVVSIILSLHKLDGLRINGYVIGIVGEVLGITSAMAGILVFLNKGITGVKFGQIAQTIFILGGVVAAIRIIIYSVQALNDVSVSGNVILLLGVMGLVILTLSTVLTYLPKNPNDIKNAATSVASLIALSSSLYILALSIKTLSDIKINPSAIVALAVAGGMIAGMFMLSKLIGKGGQYVMIGVAAIIALTVAIVGCAYAVKLLGEVNWTIIADGIKSITNAINKQGFAKMAEFIGFLWMFGFALMIAAPGIAILGLSISASIYIIAVAIEKLTGPLLIISGLFEDFINSLSDTDSEFSKFMDNLSKNKDKIVDLSNSIIFLAESFILLGVGTVATSIGLWTINRNIFALVGSAIGLAVAIDIAALGIYAISKNLEGFQSILDEVHEHIVDIIEIILGLGSSGKGFMYIGIGIAALGFGILETAKAVKVFGQGILWVVAGLAAAVIVFKLLNEYTNGGLLNGLKALGDYIKNNMLELTIVSLLFIWIVKQAAKSIKKFGQSLIWLGGGLASTALGMFLLVYALKPLNEIEGWKVAGNLLLIAIGLAAFNVILSLISPIMVTVLPLLVPLAAGLTLVGKSLDTINTDKNYATLGMQLIGLALGMMAFTGASVIFDLFSKNIDSASKSLSILAERSMQWISLSVNIRTVLSNIGDGILYFGESVDKALTAISNSINTISTSIDNGINSVATDISNGITNIANSIQSASLTILSAAYNISSAIDQVVASINGAKNSLSFINSDSPIGKLFGTSTGSANGLFNFAEIGSWIPKSLADGIRNASYYATSAMLDLADNYVEGTFRTKEDINSPSKIWEDIGSWIPKSLANGIYKSANVAKESVLDLSTNYMEEPLRDDLGIHSMSEILAEIGEWFSKSIGIGIVRGSDGTLNSLEILEGGIADSINKFTNGELEKAVNGASGLITGFLNKVKGIKENGFASLFDLKKLAKELGIDVSAFTDMFEGLANQLKIGENELPNYADQISNVGDAASSTKGTIESLTDTIKNQMKIFERFTFDEDMIDPQELIHNMESQLRGVRNWTTGLDMLTARGISGPLLQYLSEMGPESYKYVEAFLEMTNEEFAYANDLYTESLSVPNEMANKIADDYRELGVEVVDAIKSGGGSAADAAGDVASEGAEKVRQISVAGTWTTLEEIDKLAKDNGPLAMAHYCNEAGKWMDTAEFNEFAAKVQGKMSGVMHLPISDLIRKSGLKQVMAGQMNNMTYELMKRDYGNETGSFYIDGMTRALSASEYLEECHKRGEVIAAYIDTGVNPDYTGKEIGTEIVSSVSKAIDSEESVQQLVTANSNLYKTVDERLSETLMKSGEEAGKNYVAGFTAGFKDEETNKTLLDTMNSKADEWNRFLKEDKLKEQSPSKLTKEYGINYILGFVKGIIDTNNEVENGMNLVGNTAISSLSDTIQAISAQFTDDLDTTPTIRPVLDLDNVYSGMTELDTMFSTAQARVAGKAYVTTHDDSVERLEDAYKKAIMDGNLELANMLLNSEDTNVIVNVTLDANAEGIFDIVKVENEKETRRSGASPLMIARKNAINAGVIA